MLLLPACSTGAGGDPRGGDVVLDAEPVGADSVAFYFAPGSDRSDARDAARDAMDAAGLKIDELSTRVNDDDSVLRVRAETEIDTRLRRFEHAVPKQVLSSVWRDGSLFLDIPAAARLSSSGRVIEWNPLELTYEVPPNERATFAYSMAHLVSLIGGLLLVLVGARLATAAYVARVRRTDEEAVDKAHKLQRLMFVSMLLLPLVLFAGIIFSGFMFVPEVLLGELWPSAPEGVLRATVIVTLMLVVVGAIFAVALPIQPYYRELRGIEQTQKESRRRLLRGLAVGLAFPLVWIVGLNLLDHVVSGWPRAALMVVLFLVILSVTPMLVATAFGRADLDPQLRERLLTFTRSHGVKVRDIRAIKGRTEKHANALVAGVIPPFKYIFITDYLVEQLDDEELMAIVAHEVGHAKKRHLLIKLVVPFLSIAAMVGLIALLGALDVLGDGALIPLLVALPLVMVGSVFLVQGVVGLRLEHSADDFAKETVGLEPTISALEKLAEANMAKRDTGRVFNLLAQHPSIEKRVERLRDERGQAA